MGCLSAVRTDERSTLIYDTQLGKGVEGVGGAARGSGSNPTRRNPAYSWAGKQHHTSLVGFSGSAEGDAT